MTVQGVDVSGYQGTVNWADLKNKDGIELGICKATQSINFMDGSFTFNWKMIKQEGLTARVAYHFIVPSTDAGMYAQASYFKRIVGPLGPGDTWMVDIEPKAQGAPLPTADDLKAFVQTVLAQVSKPGILYGNLDDLKATNAVPLARDMGCIINLANYGVNDGNDHGVPSDAVAYCGIHSESTNTHQRERLLALMVTTTEICG